MSPTAAILTSESSVWEFAFVITKFEAVLEPITPTNNKTRISAKRVDVLFTMILNKYSRIDLKELTQRLCLSLANIALSAQYFRNSSSRSYDWNHVGLPEILCFH